MTPTAVVRDSTRGRERSSVAVLIAWMLASGAPAFLVPWVTFYVEPNDSAPWWTTWVPIGAWVLTGTFGLAWVLAGGRVRRIGAAIILGEALGFVLFFVSFFWSFAHASGGWD
jgi:hypothetical protein